MNQDQNIINVMLGFVGLYLIHSYSESVETRKSLSARCERLEILTEQMRTEIDQCKEDALKFREENGYLKVENKDLQIQVKALTIQRDDLLEKFVDQGKRGAYVPA